MAFYDPCKAGAWHQLQAFVVVCARASARLRQSREKTADIPELVHHSPELRAGSEAKHVNFALRDEFSEEKQKVKVERKKGEKLGLEGDLALIQGISGAVWRAQSGMQQYNDLLPSDSLQRIRVGDAVAKVDGASGKNLADAQF
eukprot:Skav218296  [mRNA]  locus=scaffold2388:82776:84617:+ [translate_table: standard]